MHFTLNVLQKNFLISVFCLPFLSTSLLAQPIFGSGYVNYSVVTNGNNSETTELARIYLEFDGFVSNSVPNFPFTFVSLNGNATLHTTSHGNYSSDGYGNLLFQQSPDNSFVSGDLGFSENLNNAESMQFAVIGVDEFEPLTLESFAKSLELDGNVTLSNGNVLDLHPLELEFVTNSELRKVEVNGEFYFVPVVADPTTGYFFILDEDKKPISDLSPTIVASLMQASAMLSEIEQYDGEQMLQRMIDAEDDMRGKAILNRRGASFEAIENGVVSLVASPLGGLAGAVLGGVENAKLGYSSCAVLDETIGVVCGAALGVKGVAAGSIIGTIKSIDLALNDFDSEVGSAARTSAVYHSAFEDIKSTVTPINNQSSKDALTVEQKLGNLTSQDTMKYADIVEGYIDSFDVKRRVEVAEFLAGAAYSEQSIVQILQDISLEKAYALIDALTLGFGTALEAENEIDFFEEAQKLSLRAEAEDFFDGSVFDDIGKYLSAAYLNKHSEGLCGGLVSCKYTSLDEMVRGEISKFGVRIIVDEDGVEIASSDIASIEQWNITGGQGNVKITTTTGNSFIASLIAGSPVWIERQVDTFYDYYKLSFNASFGSNVGILSVLLGGDVLFELDAADFTVDELLTFEFDFFKMLDWSDSETLRFHWLSSTGNFADVSSINLTGNYIQRLSSDKINAPGNIGLVAISLFTILFIHRKRKIK